MLEFLCFCFYNPSVPPKKTVDKCFKFMAAAAATVVGARCVGRSGSRRIVIDIDVGTDIGTAT